jgi:aryl sulfotransferase
MGEIIWLASYPKSGNTWLRAFLTNFLCHESQPASINALEGGPIAAARHFFDEAVGLEASDLSPEEIECYRPAVHRYMAARSPSTLFLKIHDAYTYTPEGVPLVPVEATHGAIYILRNPLDVSVSFAHHSNISLDESIQRMTDESFALANTPSRLHLQLRQKLLSWSSHVLSWVEAPGLRVHIVRYEDMHRRPQHTFTGIVRFAGLSEDPERVDRALDRSSFARLQQQEQLHGFVGKSPHAPSFFRKGQVGSWREVLTEAQIDRLLRDHAPVMRRFGYLTDTGEVVY